MTYNFTIPNRRKKYTWIDWGMAIAGLLLLILGKIIPAVILFIMSALGFLTRRDIRFSFMEEEVVFDTFPKKTFQWADFNNVILKDGMLTMDFKNNKLIQEEVLENDNDFNEKQFNDFCIKKITS